MIDDLTLDLARTTGSSPELMIAIMDQSQDCIKVVGPDGRLGFMNRNGRCAMEIDDFCAVQGQYWWDLWPEESQQQVRDAVAAAKAGQSSRFEAFCPTAKGTPRWWDVSASPVRDGDGAVISIVSISRDITDRVAARESMATMAMEMRHRLRNAYAVSGAIALASGREEPEHKAFASQLAERFGALSKAQTRMLDAGAGHVALFDLIGDLTAPFRDEAGQIAVAGPTDVVVDEQAARLVALVIGELCTNSIKHGALRAGGTIGITVKAAADSAEAALDWQEQSAVNRSAPDVAPDAPKTGGSGMNLMARMARAHGGQFDIAVNDGDVAARLTVPARISG